MKVRSDEAGSRREFFRRLARGAAFGGLALLAGVLLAKKRAPSRRETCISRGVCRGCPALEGCGLPQALSLRRARGRGRGR